MCDFDDGFLADVLEGGGKMEFDYSVLRGKIRELYGSEKAFASAIVMASATLSMKLNNRREFTQGESARSWMPCMRTGPWRPGIF